MCRSCTAYRNGRLIYTILAGNVSCVLFNIRVLMVLILTAKSDIYQVHTYHISPSEQPVCRTAVFVTCRRKRAASVTEQAEGFKTREPVHV